MGIELIDLPVERRRGIGFWICLPAALIVITTGIFTMIRNDVHTQLKIKFVPGYQIGLLESGLIILGFQAVMYGVMILFGAWLIKNKYPEFGGILSIMASFLNLFNYMVTSSLGLGRSYLFMLGTLTGMTGGIVSLTLKR